MNSRPIDSGSARHGPRYWHALNTGAGTLTVTGNTYGGEAVSHWAGDDDYVAEADVDLNSDSIGQLNS